MTFPLNPKGYTSVTDYAQEQGVTTQTVYNWINKNKIESAQASIFGQTRHFVKLAKTKTMKRAKRN